MQNKYHFYFPGIVFLCKARIMTEYTPSASHSKNILREYPLCPMRGSGHFNCKTNCETNRAYWHEHGDT